MKNDWEVTVEELLLYLEQLANLKSEEKRYMPIFWTSERNSLAFLFKKQFFSSKEINTYIPELFYWREQW